MKIKKFRGYTFREAVSRMKQEFGPNAVIIESDKVKVTGNEKGEDSRENFEITAAIYDMETPEKNIAAAKQVGTATVARKTAVKTNGNGNSNSGIKAGMPEKMAAKGNKSIVLPEPVLRKITDQNKQIAALQTELRDIKQVLYKVSDHLKYNSAPSLPEFYGKLYKKLVANEVNENLAKGIAQTLYNQTDALDHKNENAILKNLYNLLVRILKVAPPLENISRKPYVSIIAGPTGVGKTTTVAKLAANLKLYSKLNVALISVDTYRIAAIEQLKTFARIANIPMAVVYSPDEIRKAISNFSDWDVVLIDTVGRSQKDEDHLKILNEFIEKSKANEVQLALSMTTSLKNMVDVIRQFGVLRPNRLIFTKADEAANTGNILNILYKYQIPISYISTGQVVPTDIQTASSSMLANLVYSGKYIKK